MKRSKHYAGDAVQSVQLPYFCRWARVIDFDALGVISTAAGTALSPAGVPGGNFIVPQEPPAIRLDSRDFTPVYAHSIYRPVYNPADMASYFQTLELQGNIEVEYGERGDADPGPLRFGQVSAPFEYAMLSSFTTYLFLPKNVKSMWLHFRDAAGVPLTSLVIRHLIPVTSPSVATMANTGQAGYFSPWEPGSALRPTPTPNPPAAPFVAVRQTINIATFADPRAGRLFTLPAATPANYCSVQFVDGGNPIDDAANASYTRIWSPGAGIEILPNDGGAVNAIIVRGHVTCAY
jgi:hypothetical protein